MNAFKKLKFSKDGIGAVLLKIDSDDVTVVVDKVRSRPCLAANNAVSCSSESKRQRAGWQRHNQTARKPNEHAHAAHGCVGYAIPPPPSSRLAFLPCSRLLSPPLASSLLCHRVRLKVLVIRLSRSFEVLMVIPSPRPCEAA